jgi:hypothetical protein
MGNLLPSVYPSLPSEAKYQNLIRKGFTIIRESYPFNIEIKNKDKRGWYRIKKFTTAAARTQAVYEMLQIEKTIKMD